MRKRNSWGKGASIFLALAFVAPAMAVAKDRQFDAIVRGIEARYHRKPMRFMGLVSFIANRARPEGVKNLRFAVFEDLDTSANPPASDFAEFVARAAGPEFHPFVRVESRRDGEQTHVFARPLNNDFELLIVCVERDEATVMRMRLNPERMSEWEDDPAGKARHSAHGTQDTR